MGHERCREVHLFCHVNSSCLRAALSCWPTDLGSSDIHPSGCAVRAGGSLFIAAPPYSGSGGCKGRLDAALCLSALCRQAPSAECRRQCRGGSVVLEPARHSHSSCTKNFLERLQA